MGQRSREKRWRRRHVVVTSNGMEIETYPIPRPIQEQVSKLLRERGIVKDPKRIGWFRSIIRWFIRS